MQLVTSMWMRPRATFSGTAPVLACRPSYLSPLGWLALQAAALWPHGAWLARRVQDGSDEPLGLAALALLLMLLVARSHALRVSPHTGWLAAGALLTLAANAALLVAPPLLCALLAALAAVTGRVWQGLVRRGQRPAAKPARAVLGRAVARGLLGLYALVLALLAFTSVAGVWTFPSLPPQVWSAAAWASVGQAAGTVGFTAGLALAASASALLLVVAWLEATPPAWDRRATPVLMLPLVVPALLLVVGLYQAALGLGIDGTRLGLWSVHTLLVLPYAFIALAPAWRSFDLRYEWTALALGRSRFAFWWRVKWPLLLAPLAAAAAVGFAVSVAQYLPTQFIGAGRHATVTTEAVTLASGGQRTLAAAFALLQALLPALGFGAAHALARWQRQRIQ